MFRHIVLAQNFSHILAQKLYIQATPKEFMGVGTRFVTVAGC